MNIQNSDHQALYQHGREAMEKGDFSQALESLRKSAELFSHFKTYESVGECYLRLGEPGKAIMFLAAAAGLGSKQFRCYFLLAEALLGISDVHLARIKLGEALEMNPNYKAARELLSTIPEVSQTLAK